MGEKDEDKTRSKCLTWDELGMKPACCNQSPCAHGMCENKDCKEDTVAHQFKAARARTCRPPTARKTGKTWCEYSFSGLSLCGFCPCSSRSSEQVAVSD